MRLIRVVAPHFVAGFESDGTVRRAAPILGFMTGWSDDRARVYMAAKGWRASVIERHHTDEIPNRTGRREHDPDQA
jgi:hypothetical protein